MFFFLSKETCLQLLHVSRVLVRRVAHDLFQVIHPLLKRRMVPPLITPQTPGPIKTGLVNPIGKTTWTPIVQCLNPYGSTMFNFISDLQHIFCPTVFIGLIPVFVKPHSQWLDFRWLQKNNTKLTKQQHWVKIPNFRAEIQIFVVKALIFGTLRALQVTMRVFQTFQIRIVGLTKATKARAFFGFRGGVRFDFDPWRS